MTEIKENSRWNKTNRKKREKEIVSRTEKRAVSLSKAEIKTYDQFFKGEHPDTRSNSQFLKDMGFKVAEKKREGLKWYPIKSKVGRLGVEIKCIDNGKIYKSLRDAGADLGLNHTNLSKHLRGDKAYNHVGGMKFQYV